jgi:very-short-patch-repair endonuclease
MRRQLLKLKKGKSTKAERQFSELLKKGHIPFRTKVVIKNREIDFVIGLYAIDIDGHRQDSEKNVLLVKTGYIPIHISNNEVKQINVNKFS